MVTPGGSGETQTIKLEMTIDKAELERQLGTVFGPSGGNPLSPDGAPGGGRGSPRKPQKIGPTRPDATPPGPGMRPLTPPDSTGGERGATSKPQKVDAAGKMLKGMKYMAGLVGIGLTLGAMLKLSKVMAAATHALQSILGAMIDSFLAPIMVELLPVLKWIASMIPHASTAGQGIGDTIAEAKTLPEKLRQRRERERARYGSETGGDTMFALKLAKVLGESVLDTVKLGVQGGGAQQRAILKLGGANTERLKTPDWLRTGGQKAAESENAARERAGKRELGWFKSLFGPLPKDLTRQNQNGSTYNFNITANSGDEAIKKAEENLRDVFSRGDLAN